VFVLVWALTLFVLRVVGVQPPVPALGAVIAAHPAVRHKHHERAIFGCEAPMLPRLETELFRKSSKWTKGTPLLALPLSLSLSSNQCLRVFVLAALDVVSALVNFLFLHFESNL